MAIQLEQNLESLLPRIGNYEKSTIDVPFPREGAKTLADEVEPLISHFFENYARLVRELGEFTPEVRDLLNKSLWRDDWWHNNIGILWEAISNAGNHGPGLTERSFKYMLKHGLVQHIRLDAYYGTSGLIYLLDGPGSGFDVIGTVEKLRRKDRHTTRRRYGGQGLELFEERNAVVTYQYTGRFPPDRTLPENQTYGSKCVMLFEFKGMEPPL